MTHANTLNRINADVAPKSGISALLISLRDTLARRQVYRNTLNELRGLSERELADLGLHPTMLKRVAWQAAQEK